MLNIVILTLSAGLGLVTLSMYVPRHAISMERVGGFLLVAGLFAIGAQIPLQV